jgi:ABC-type antimicrobial peptide transport system permease subunit
MQSFYYSVPLWIKGNETAIASQHRFVDTMAISPDYFKTLKIPILAGRAFTAADRDNQSQVIIVDDVVAKQMWPGESAIGKQVVLNEFDENPDLQVIGVVPQVKKYGPDQEVPRNQVYRPLMQYPQKYMSVVIDYDGDLEALKRAAQEKVYRMDKTVPLYNIQTLEKLFSVVIGNRTASAALLVSFAGAALLLSIIGIYGVVSNWVVRRRQELAIRLALGSSLAGVKRLIIRQVAVCAVPAILLGSILVLVFSRSLSRFLVGVHGSDPGTHFVAVTSIAGVIFVASLRSLRRLLRVDPQELMKE